MTEYFKIGKIVAVFGLKGNIILHHNLGKKTSLKGLANIFIEHNKENFIPYFIESAIARNENEISIKLEGIDSREEAGKVLAREVWLQESDFKKYASATSPIYLLGFNLINNKIDLGPILEVIEQPHQLLCKIMLGTKEALIPMHEASLQKIDKKNRKVFVSLPDGLLEIYQ